MKKRTLLLLLLAIAGLTGLLLALAPTTGRYPEFVSVTINGQEIDHPGIKTAAGLFGILVSVVAVLCAFAAVVLVLSGTGLIVGATLVFVGLVLAAVAAPFLLPILVPLGILLLFPPRKSCS